MKNNIGYSVVIPVYNEQQVVEETYTRLKEIMDMTKENYELLFVNDGSRDRTTEIIRRICAKDHHVRLIDFSRNFGHQIAITAGMNYASGKAIIVIDADLQDPPEVILEMIKKWKVGYDVVYGKRLHRKGETVFKRVTAAVFYRLLQYITNVNIPVDTGDFRLIDRKVCDIMNQFTERNRYVRGLVSWSGFRQTAVEYIREERWAGETKYPLKKMIKFALDALMSFSHKPLKIASYMGYTLSAASFLYLMLVIYQRLFTDTTIQGWASIVAVNLFFNGIILIILGVIGEYLGRVYDESKNRPLYVIKDKRGFKDEESDQKGNE